MEKRTPLIQTKMPGLAARVIGGQREAQRCFDIDWNYLDVVSFRKKNYQPSRSWGEGAARVRGMNCSPSGISRFNDVAAITVLWIFVGDWYSILFLQLLCGQCEGPVAFNIE